MDRQESNYLIPILSALAGLGAIITSISPLFVQNTVVMNIFIDRDVVTFASLTAFLTVLSALWMTTSINSYSLFSRADLNQEKTKFNALKLFITFSLVFYLSKLLVNEKIIASWVGSSMQLISYLLGFLSLAVTIGFMLRDSIQSFKRNEIEASKYERIKNTLLKTGKIDFDLSLEAILNRTPRPGDPLDLFNTRDIYFTTNGKKFHSIVSWDYSSIIFTEEIPAANPDSPKNQDKSSIEPPKEA